MESDKIQQTLTTHMVYQLTFLKNFSLQVFVLIIKSTDEK